MNTSLDYARKLDAQDPLTAMRGLFSIPKQAKGKEGYYFTGNSLGLQPVKAKQAVLEVLDAWQQYGVKGHFAGDFPWMPYHEFLTNAHIG